MTPATRLHVYELYHAWLACYGQPPTIDDVTTWGGVPRGKAYACLWRMGVLP